MDWEPVDGFHLYSLSKRDEAEKNAKKNATTCSFIEDKDEIVARTKGRKNAARKGRVRSELSRVRSTIRLGMFNA